MALNHTTRVFGVTECKIYPITLDVTGSATAYGAGVKVPGVQNVTVSATIDTKQLFGDNVLLDSDSVMKTCEIELDMAKLNMDVLGTLFGGTITDAGTTPSQTSTFNLSNPPVFGYVKIMARTIYDDFAPVTSSDLTLMLGKAKATTFPNVGFVNEDYNQPKMKFQAVPPLGTGSQWLQLVAHETGVPLT